MLSNTLPPSAQVDSIQSDALFILLVEKDAAFMRLAEDRFYNQVRASASASACARLGGWLQPGLRLCSECSGWLVGHLL